MKHVNTEKKKRTSDKRVANAQTTKSKPTKKATQQSTTATQHPKKNGKKNQAAYKKFEKQQRQMQKQAAKRTKKLRRKKQLQMLEAGKSVGQAPGRVYPYRKRKKNYTLYYILVLFFVLAIGLVLSVTVLFNIQAIHLMDSSAFSLEQFIQITRIEQGDNLLRISTTSAEHRMLNAYPNLDTIEVKRRFPADITVQYQLCTPTTILAQNGNLYVFSQSGRLMQITDTLDETLQSILCFSATLPAQLQPGDFYDFSDLAHDELLTQIQDAIDQAGLEHVTYIDAVDALNITLVCDQNTAILIGTTSDLRYKIKMAAAALRNEQGGQDGLLIDARKAGSAFVRVTDSIDKYLPTYKQPSVDNDEQPATSDLSENETVD